MRQNSVMTPGPIGIGRSARTCITEPRLIGELKGPFSLPAAQIKQSVAICHAIG
jgi:hypothetical protein